MTFGEYTSSRGGYSNEDDKDEEDDHDYYDDDDDDEYARISTCPNGRARVVHAYPGV